MRRSRQIGGRLEMTDQLKLINMVSYLAKTAFIIKRNKIINTVNIIAYGPLIV